MEFVYPTDLLILYFYYSPAIQHGMTEPDTVSLRWLMLRHLAAHLDLTQDRNIDCTGLATWLSLPLILGKRRVGSQQCVV